MGCGASKSPSYALELAPAAIDAMVASMRAADMATGNDMPRSRAGSSSAPASETAGFGNSVGRSGSGSAGCMPISTSSFAAGRPIDIIHFVRGRGEFMMRDIIGKGGKSVGVQVGYHPRTRGYYALKFINEALAASEGWEVQPVDELEAMRAVTLARVPFTTPLRGWFEQPAPAKQGGGVDLALVMGYMPGGELFSRMAGRRMGADEAAFYAAEVVCALQGMHSLGYIYR